MSVTLRAKPIQGGKLRLYFDFYPPIVNPVTGKYTRREILSLFLYSEIEHQELDHQTTGGNKVKKVIPVIGKDGQPKKIRLSPLQRQHNKETEELAETIRAQRVLALQQEDYGFLSHDKNADFLQFVKDISDERKEKGDTKPLSVYNYLHKFSGGACPVSKITESFCNEFRDYLSTVIAFEDGKQRKLSNNSAALYYTIFKTLLRRAQKVMYIAVKIDELEGLKKRDSIHREFLTYDELRAVAAAPCDLPLMKNAALFSALTGLRWSDIEKLMWQEIIEDGKNIYIRFVTQKTSRAETLPISLDAFNLLGQRGAPTDKVFKGVKYGAWQNNVISRWVHKAGVNKHITFHCFRHTYAVLQISLGTDVYTVSKMLGHSNITTTQIYAKIVDEKKQDAANKIHLSIPQP